MTFYRPCFNCAFAKLPCARREAVAAGIKGLGLTSLKFRCSERRPAFAVGQRVEVGWMVSEPDGECGLETTREHWPATVVAERGNKFQILVDDVDSDYGTSARGYIKNETLYAKVSASKLRPLAEPPREVCGTCQGVAADGTVTGCFGWAAKEGWDGHSAYTPEGCLKARLPFFDKPEASHA